MATTAPDASLVPTLAGRELDAMLAEHLFGWKNVREWKVVGWIGDEPDEVYDRDKTSVPEFSSSEGPPFFALLQRLREQGWNYQMQNAPGDDVVVSLWKTINTVAPGNERKATGSTLPLALARAALLTCCANTANGG